MKINRITLILFSFICIFFYSCSDDDDEYLKRDNQENRITFKVRSNTPGVPITIDEFYGGVLIIKDYWEGEYVTKRYGAQFTANCEDKTVLITGEIYVNGKLKLRRDGNGQVRLIVNNIK